MAVSIFRSAISGSDGEVDAGYLAMFTLMVIVTGAIPAMCIGAFVAMWLNPGHQFDVQGLGVGIGAVCAGFAAAIGGVGAFRMGDKPHVATPTPQTVTATAATGGNVSASVTTP